MNNYQLKNLNAKVRFIFSGNSNIDLKMLELFAVGSERLFFDWPQNKTFPVEVYESLKKIKLELKVGGNWYSYELKDLRPVFDARGEVPGQIGFSLDSNSSQELQTHLQLAQVAA